MRKICFLISMIVCLLVQAQSTEKLYTQGKALYDAKNYAKAFPLFQTAAQKGHKKAQYRLGLCYDKGRGVKEDDKQAFYWYGLSANQGYAKAQYQSNFDFLSNMGLTPANFTYSNIRGGIGLIGAISTTRTEPFIIEKPDIPAPATN